jgi:hypothetical protein
VTSPVQALPASHHALTVLQLYPGQCQVPIAGIAQIDRGGESRKHCAFKGCEALPRTYPSDYRLFCLFEQPRGAKREVNRMAQGSVSNNTPALSRSVLERPTLFHRGVNLFSRGLRHSSSTEAAAYSLLVTSPDCWCIRALTPNRANTRKKAQSSHGCR